MSAAAVLTELEGRAVERFPGDAPTIRLFAAELERALAPGAPPGAALEHLLRFEDFLEALLARDRWRRGAPPAPPATPRPTP